MSYYEYYCNRRHLSLVVKTQSETYIQQVLTCPAEKSWQTRSSSTSEVTLIFILVFSLARSSSLFLLCFSSSGFLFPLFDVDNGGACFCSVVAVQFEFERIWPGESRSFLSLNNSQINLTPSHSTVRQSDQHLYATYESLYHSHGYPLQSQTFTSVCIFL